MSLFLKTLLTTVVLSFSFLIISIFLVDMDSMYIFSSIVAVFSATCFGLVWACFLAPRAMSGSSPTAVSTETANTLLHEPAVTLASADMFQKTFDRAISYAKRKHKMMALIIVRFNANEIISESMQQSLSMALETLLRTEDVCASVEKGEFAILLTDINKPKFASLVAEKILKTVSAEHSLSVLKPDMGISIYPDDGESVEKLVFIAESALHEAKKDGAGQYYFHNPQMNREAREFVQLADSLRRSISNNELSIYYQPKLDIKKGAITSVEALIRWTHPELGILSPAQFIPVAEETGFMTEMGIWLLNEVCRDNKFWQNEGYEHVTTSVNLSPVQFHQPGIASQLKNILKNTGLSPQYLEIEINEATVMDNVELATRVLKAIKESGVRLSIDHFGTGYTSVSHLKHFPINAIKIDKSYIKGIPNSPDDCAITDAFISLAHHLGFEIVAEGVETAEQLQHLSLQHCDTVQGYLLGPPLPADKISEQFNKFVDHALS